LYAAERGYQDMVKYLVEHGANINAQGVYLKLIGYKRGLFII